MKRYLSFAGANYYPEGGWDDFVGSFDTPQEAAAAGVAEVDELGMTGWYHVVDATTGKIVGT